MSQELNVDWLKGIKVLLVAHYIPGPLAAYLLRWLGAEIIKVEPPFGDYMRGMPPFIKNENKKISAYFRALNGGFKSLALDLKSERGIAVLKDLIKNCDLLIDGNRAGYMESLFGASIASINSQIIHVPITGQGLKGPLCDSAAHDNNLLAFSGGLSYSDGLFGSQLADITAGYLAAFMGVSGLLARKNNSLQVQPGVIDVSMLHAASFLNQIYIAGMNATGESPEAGKELLNGAAPNYRIYHAKNGERLFFGPIEPKLFKNFCKKIGNDKLFDLLGSDNNKLHQELENIFATKDLDEWATYLKDCDCCFSRVNNLKQAINESQIKELGLVHQVEDKNYGKLSLSGFPAGFTSESRQPNISAPAPELGEHSIDILINFLKYQDEQLKVLIDEKVVIGAN